MKQIQFFHKQAKKWPDTYGRASVTLKDEYVGTLKTMWKPTNLWQLLDAYNIHL